MKSIRLNASWILVSMLLPAFVLASDFNPLGTYVGASIGEGRDMAGDALGWKILGGLRPLSFLGAEAEYVDFGSSNTEGGLYRLAARAHGEAVFAVAYLPFPLPRVDPFVKAGWSHVDAHASGTLSCPAPEFCIVALNETSHDSGFAYGAGLQAHLAHLRIRAEYERTSDTMENPSLLSIGANWTF